MTSNKVLEHLEFTIPHSWQDEMNCQGFVVTENSIDKFVEFWQQLEMGEDVYDATHTLTKTQPKGSEKTGSVDNKTKTKKTENDKFCLFHGWNPTHVSDKCLVLKAQAEKWLSNRP